MPKCQAPGCLSEFDKEKKFCSKRCLVRAAYHRNVEQSRRRKREATAKWRKTDLGRRYAARWQMEHPDRGRHNSETVKRWRSRNIELIRLRRNENHRRKYASDLEYKLRHVLKRTLLDAIRALKFSKSRSALCLCGCSLPELGAHLESQFKRGMTWKNHGTLWHIDHIIPVSKFDLTKPEEQRRCFHYLNLQPLWKSDNLKK